MSRFIGIIATIIIITGVVFYLHSNLPHSEKPLPQKRGQKYELLFQDNNNRLYRRDNQLILVSNHNLREIITVPETSLTRNRIIKYKAENDLPLRGQRIEKGLILSGKENYYIVTLEPEFKLISTYPQVDSYQNKYILVNKKRNILYFYQNGLLVKEYTVSTGKMPWYTPEGTFSVANKIPYPKGKDPQAPMGPRWLGLKVPYNSDKRGNKVNGGLDPRSPAGQKFGIHGTNDESTIGTHASGGCIRLYNHDILELYDMVPIGTIVEIRPD